jgi:putative transposase
MPGGDIAGITQHPDGAYMARMARNLTDCFDGYLKNHRFLICDRDTKFSAKFKRILSDAGVEVILTPRQAPNCNAYAERFVLSPKSECLNRMIFFGEESYRRALREYVEHYHIERTHQGIGTERIEPYAVGSGSLQCTERLGGLLKCYSRAA